jgi:uncharacterized protein YbjT (DUF2867 family)
VKIAIVGGTGFLGRHISKALIDSGHEVRVLSRDPSKVSSIPELAGATSTRADVTDPASLSGTLDEMDAVIGAVQFPNYPMELPRKRLTFDRYDRLGTENLLTEATRAGVRKYVYISGAGVTPTSDKSWYRAKGLAEVAIRDSGLDYALVRPSWAYGPEDKAINKFRAIARISPVIPQPGVRPQRIQPVHVDDIALVVARVFERDAWNETYEVGGPDVMTMTEVIRTLLDVMGKRRWIVPIPVPLMKLATAPLVVLPKPPLTPTGVEFATQDGLVDNTNIGKLLDVHPVPLREGLRRYLGSS